MANLQPQYEYELIHTVWIQYAYCPFPRALNRRKNKTSEMEWVFFEKFETAGTTGQNVKETVLVDEVREHVCVRESHGQRERICTHPGVKA